MRVHRDLETQQYYWPVKNTAALVKSGSLLMPGVTAETDLGVLIPATSDCADSIGILQADILAADTNLLVAGTAWLVKEVVPVAPMRIIRCAYDTSDTMAVASTSTTTVTITSLEDNIDTSYLYAVSGTGIGSLAYVAQSSSGSCVTKTATGWDSTTTAIKILRLFHKLAKINSTSDKIGTDAAAGTWKIDILQNYIQRGGITSILCPTAPQIGTNAAASSAVFTVGDNLTGLNLYGDLLFSADLAIRNSGAYVSA